MTFKANPFLKAPQVAFLQETNFEQSAAQSGAASPESTHSLQQICDEAENVMKALAACEVDRDEARANLEEHVKAIAAWKVAHDDMSQRRDQLETALAALQKAKDDEKAEAERAAAEKELFFKETATAAGSEIERLRAALAMEEARSAEAAKAADSFRLEAEKAASALAIAEATMAQEREAALRDRESAVAAAVPAERQERTMSSEGPQTPQQEFEVLQQAAGPAAESKIRSLEAEVAKSQSDLGVSRSRVAELEEKVATLTTAMVSGASQSDESGLRATVARLEKEVAVHKTTAEKLEKDLEATVSQYKRLETQAAERERVRAELEAVIAELQRGTAEAEEARERAASDLAATKDAVAAKERALSVATEDDDRNLIEHDLAKLQARLEKDRGDFQQATDELAVAKAKLDEGQEKLRARERQWAKAAAAVLVSLQRGADAARRNLYW